jgi:hypothetical protein
MGRFIARGTITLNAAMFVITADNIEQARKKAREGDFSEYDLDGAEAVDWEINVATVEG